MGSIYKRRNCYWAKFRDPLKRQELRVSLETQEEGAARCKLRKIELLCELRSPELTITTLPGKLEQLLLLEEVPSPSSESACPPAKVLPPSVETRMGIEKALLEYLAFIRAENASTTVDNKLSILRRFFGSKMMSRLSETTTKNGSLIHEPAFHGRYVDEITAGVVQKFIEKGDAAKKTRRHYRELFHHFFEFLLKRHMIEPRSWHTPNGSSSSSHPLIGTCSKGGGHDWQT